jgi:hypothetical protein
MPPTVKICQEMRPMFKHPTTIVLAVLAALLLAPALHAQEDDVTGQLTVSMDSDYAKVYVGGEHWESVEYEKSGKVAIIKSIELSTEPIVVSLRPVYDHLEPVTLELKIKDFKRKRVKRMYILAAKRRVKFPKSKKVKPETAPTPTPDEERTPRVVPGEEEDDL